MTRVCFTVADTGRHGIEKKGWVLNIVWVGQWIKNLVGAIGRTETRPFGHGELEPTSTSQTDLGR